VADVAGQREAVRGARKGVVEVIGKAGMGHGKLLETAHKSEEALNPVSGSRLRFFITRYGVAWPGPYVRVLKKKYRQ
jgi:hypothetical protein